MAHHSTSSRDRIQSVRRAYHQLGPTEEYMSRDVHVKITCYLVSLLLGFTELPII